MQVLTDLVFDVLYRINPRIQLAFLDLLSQGGLSGKKDDAQGNSTQ